MSTGRLEAFSDGVIAVAITLLVLDIHVPPPGSHLARDLSAQWPVYAAYVTSFITIGIIWINHHVALSRLRIADHTTMIVNLLLLMSIAVIPFGTSLLARYLKQGHGDHLAAAVYAGILLVMGILFSVLNRHILHVKPDLMRVEIPRERRSSILKRNVSGVTPYAIALALAPISAYATLAICSAIAVFYAFPVATGEDEATSEP